jgi:hypothetical protein
MELLPVDCSSALVSGEAGEDRSSQFGLSHPPILFIARAGAR